MKDRYNKLEMKNGKYHGEQIYLLRSNGNIRYGLIIIIMV